jgi:hypothetical protein
MELAQAAAQSAKGSTNAVNNYNIFHCEHSFVFPIFWIAVAYHNRGLVSTCKGSLFLIFVDIFVRNCFFFFYKAAFCAFSLDITPLLD